MASPDTRPIQTSERRALHKNSNANSIIGGNGLLDSLTDDIRLASIPGQLHRQDMADTVIGHFSWKDPSANHIKLARHVSGDG